MAFYIDIPTEKTLEGSEGAWTHVHVAQSKEEAVAWIRENIGHCDDDGNICLLTLMGEDGNEVSVIEG